MYVFTSNESNQDVLFDNLGVMQITGPVLEETHYYPFGLTMAKISTIAPLKIEAKRKFTGQVFDHKEFSDGSGLDWYEFKYRRMDPQIGRFIQIDPLAAKYPYNGTYAYAENRVVDGIDLEGLEYVRFGKYPYNGSAWDYLKAIPNAATDIVQSVVDATWNSGVANYQSIQNGTWGKDIVNDLKESGKAIKNFGVNSFNYTVNTPILQQLDDAARPQSLEVGLSILGTAALTKSIPKVELKIPKIEVVDETVGLERSGIWTSTKKLSPVETAFSHYKKHGVEFPEFYNAKQYVEGAKNFLHNTPTGTLIKMRANGDILKYHPGTNTFEVMDALGVPRTMFKPTDAMKYWLGQ